MILQKTFILRGLFLLLLFGGLSAMVQGQQQCAPGATQPSGHIYVNGNLCDNCGDETATVLKLCDISGGTPSLCGPDFIGAKLDPFCAYGQVPITVYALDLAEVNENGDPIGIGDEIDWPLGQRPPIHLRYQYDNFQVSFSPTFKYSQPIRKWTYIDDVLISRTSGEDPGEGSSEVRIKVFEGIQLVNIEPLLDIRCVEGGRDPKINDMTVDVVYLEGHINEDGQVAWGADFPWSDYQLLSDHFIDVSIPYADNDTDPDTEDFFDYYPIHYYGGPGDTYNNLYFTFNDCGADCINPSPVTEDINICVECSTCLEPGRGGEGEEGSNENSRFAATNSDNLTSLMISPNPFSDFTQYKYNSKVETDITVSLFTTNGTVMIQEIQKAGIGENTYLMNTQNIPVGVYYLQVKNGLENQILRVVKVE